MGGEHLQSGDAEAAPDKEEEEEPASNDAKAAPDEDGEEAAGDIDDPFEMLGGMGAEEVYKITLVRESTEESEQKKQAPVCELERVLTPRRQIVDQHGEIFESGATIVTPPQELADSEQPDAQPDVQPEGLPDVQLDMQPDGQPDVQLDVQSPQVYDLAEADVPADAEPVDSGSADDAAPVPVVEEDGEVAGSADATAAPEHSNDATAAPEHSNDACNNSEQDASWHESDWQDQAWGGTAGTSCSEAVGQETADGHEWSAQDWNATTDWQQSDWQQWDRNDHAATGQGNDSTAADWQQSEWQQPDRSDDAATGQTNDSTAADWQQSDWQQSDRNGNASTGQGHGSAEQSTDVPAQEEESYEEALATTVQTCKDEAVGKAYEELLEAERKYAQMKESIEQVEVETEKSRHLADFREVDESLGELEALEAELEVELQPVLESIAAAHAEDAEQQAGLESSAAAHAEGVTAQEDSASEEEMPADFNPWGDMTAELDPSYQVDTSYASAPSKSKEGWQEEDWQEDAWNDNSWKGQDSDQQWNKSSSSWNNSGKDKGEDYSNNDWRGGGHKQREEHKDWQQNNAHDRQRHDKRHWDNAGADYSGGGNRKSDWKGKSDWKSNQQEEPHPKSWDDRRKGAEDSWHQDADDSWHQGAEETWNQGAEDQWLQGADRWHQSSDEKWYHDEDHGSQKAAEKRVCGGEEAYTFDEFMDWAIAEQIFKSFQAAKDYWEQSCTVVEDSNSTAGQTGGTNGWQETGANSRGDRWDRSHGQSSSRGQGSGGKDAWSERDAGQDAWNAGVGGGGQDAWSGVASATSGQDAWRGGVGGSQASGHDQDNWSAQWHSSTSSHREEAAQEGTQIWTAIKNSRHQEESSAWGQHGQGSAADHSAASGRSEEAWSGWQNQGDRSAASGKREGWSGWENQAESDEPAGNPWEDMADTVGTSTSHADNYSSRGAYVQDATSGSASVADNYTSRSAHMQDAANGSASVAGNSAGRGASSHQAPTNGRRGDPWAATDGDPWAEKDPWGGSGNKSKKASPKAATDEDTNPWEDLL